MADRQDVARQVTFYLAMPVADPVFFVVALRQALKGRSAGGALRDVPRSNDVRRHSLLFAVGLASTFAFASWAWLYWALPPDEPADRLVMALIVGDLASSLVMFSRVVISAGISQRISESVTRRRR
jgi:hypothetical protein